MPATKKTPKRSRKKETKTALHVAVVLDMSGSMSVVHHETIEGFNSYLKDLKDNSDPGDTFSLTAFDTVFEQWHIAEPIETVPYLTADKYFPRGGTALYDAIANTVADVDSRLKKERRSDEKVLVVVVTDGGENASQEYSLRSGGLNRILALINSYEEKGTWTFSWIGAGPAALREAQNLNIPQGNVVAYAQNAASTKQTMRAMAVSTSGLKLNSLGSTRSLMADAGLSNDYTQVTDDGDGATGG